MWYPKLRYNRLFTTGSTPWSFYIGPHFTSNMEPLVINKTELLDVCYLSAASQSVLSGYTITFEFPQSMVTLFSCTSSVSKPELLDRKLCLVSEETTVFTPLVVIFIAITTTVGVCTCFVHSTGAFAIFSCSAPVRYLIVITWHPPSEWTFFIGMQ